MDEQKLKREFGFYIFLGSLIGAFFGLLMGAGSANPILEVGGGALAGVFIGWFCAAGILEKETNQNK